MAKLAATIRHAGRRHKSPATRLTLEQLGTMSDDQAIAAVKRGLPAQLVQKISERLKSPLEQLAPALQLTLRTLHRRIKEGSLASLNRNDCS